MPALRIKEVMYAKGFNTQKELLPFFMQKSIFIKKIFFFFFI